MPPPVKSNLVSQQKIITDSRWYTDDDINNLLKYYLAQDNEITCLTAMSGIKNDNGDNILADNLKDFNRQRLRAVSQGEVVSNKVFVPVNLNNTHWVLLYIIYRGEANQEQSIYYFDPLGNPAPLELQQALMGQGLFPRAEIVAFDHRVQTDNYNCGPWIVEAVRNIVNSAALPDANHDIIHARTSHHAILATQSQVNGEVSQQLKEDLKSNLPSSSLPSPVKLSDGDGQLKQDTEDNREKPHETTSSADDKHTETNLSPPADSKPSAEDTAPIVTPDNIFRQLEFQAINPNRGGLLRALATALGVPPDMLRWQLMANADLLASRSPRKSPRKSLEPDGCEVITCYREHLQQNNAPTTDQVEMTLKLISLMLQKQIVVFSASHNPQVSAQEDALFMYCDNAGYYHAFVPSEDSQPAAILFEVRQVLLAGSNLTYKPTAEQLAAPLAWVQQSISPPHSPVAQPPAQNSINLPLWPQGGDSPEVEEYPIVNSDLGTEQAIKLSKLLTLRDQLKLALKNQQVEDVCNLDSNAIFDLFQQQPDLALFIEVLLLLNRDKDYQTFIDWDGQQKIKWSFSSEVVKKVFSYDKTSKSDAKQTKTILRLLEQLPEDDRLATLLACDDKLQLVSTLLPNMLVTFKQLYNLIPLTDKGVF